MIRYRLEPRLSQPLVFEHLEAKESKPHPSRAALYKSSGRIRWLWTIIYYWVFRIAPVREISLQIVHHLLAFARKSTLDRAVADLNEIVRSTVMLRAFECRNANIELRENLSTNVPVIVINREEIQQIVLNLLLNAEHAVKSTGRRGTITLSTGADGDNAFIEVSDSGPGVPPPMAGRIFEPFFTTKGVGQGTGLGLSVSLGIAEAHGGTLALVPQVEGSCFRLTLPSTPQMHVSLAAMPRPA